MKKLFALGLALATVITLLTLFALPVSASIESGECGINGDNVTWTLDTSTGVLKLEGSGDMMNYLGGAPWRGMVSVIKSIQIGNRL